MSDSASASRAQRSSALEERRKRLAEMRAQRERRTEDTAQVQASATANLEEYIDGLLQQPGAEGRQEVVETTSPPAAAPAAVAVTEASASATVDNVVAEPAPAPPPKRVETFSISTQTEESDFPEPSVAQDDPSEVPDPSERTAAEPSANETISEQVEKDPKLLSSEEVEKEVTSKPFSSFITSASKKVERVLGAPLLSDLLVDYIGETDGDTRGDAAQDSEKFVSSQQVYQCSKWTAGRDITDINWSPLHRDLLLSTYHKPMSANMTEPLSKGSAAVSSVSPNDTASSSLTPRSGELQSDGLALVWSLTMPNRPEHVFACGSPVTAGIFHPTEAPLVIGGCESGQVVVWDVRAGRLPVQKSALTSVAGASSKGHAQAICRMKVTEGGSAIVTASTDGRVNFWSLSDLREPADSVQVSDSVSSLAVVPESETLLLGDEYGSLFSCPSSATGGQRALRKQIRKLESKDENDENFGHYGMVTSISTKILKKGAVARSAGQHKGFLRGTGGLVLSSGVDWTVKLWAPAYSDKPLLSLVSHSYDYMSDVQWSPTHSSLFATASSNGTLGLWNLSESMDEPMVEAIPVEDDVGRGLNRLQWSPDGRRIGVASGDRLHVMHLTEDVVKAKVDEDAKMMNDLMARGLIERT